MSGLIKLESATISAKELMRLQKELELNSAAKNILTNLIKTLGNSNTKIGKDDYDRLMSDDFTQAWISKDHFSDTFVLHIKKDVR